MPNCTFCQRPAETGNVVQPRMCWPHLDVVLLVSKLMREQMPVTAANVVGVYRALPEHIRQRLAVTEDSIPGLLAEMQPKE